MNPDLISGFELQETILLEFIVYFALLDSMEDVDELSECELRLNDGCVAIDHEESEGVQEVLTHVVTIGIF
jgi:hypothetical protein